MKNVCYLTDCMKHMVTVPDKFYDLAFPDPQYGINWDKEGESMSAGIRKDGSKRKYNDWNNPKPKKYKKGDYDKEPPSQEYFTELFRISKYQIICGGNYFTDKIPVSGGWIVWDKKVTIPSLSKCELLWTNLINHIEIIRYLWAGYRKEKPEDRIHVNQKPVDWYKIILSRFAKPGWKIFDSHVGSGSIRIACHDLGFWFEGCEFDLDYWQAQEERYQNHIAQPECWQPEEIQEIIFSQGEYEFD